MNPPLNHRTDNNNTTTSETQNIQTSNIHSITDIGLLVKDKADRVEREKEETATFSYTRASYRILQR